MVSQRAFDVNPGSLFILIYFNSLSFVLLICKIEVIIVPISNGCCINDRMEVRSLAQCLHSVTPRKAVHCLLLLFYQ